MRERLVEAMARATFGTEAQTVDPASLSYVTEAFIRPALNALARELRTDAGAVAHLRAQDNLNMERLVAALAEYLEGADG